MTHWDTGVPLIGQKKAARGKAGFSRCVEASSRTVPLLLADTSCDAFLFRRGRCDAGVCGGMVGEELWGVSCVLPQHS
jgi:hypothetical protein